MLFPGDVRIFIKVLAALAVAAVMAGRAGAAAGEPGSTSSAVPPDVLVILADDLGYGDVKALNPQGKIPTPSLDRLAAEGMVFTDAHSTSSVCTPSRYSLLTGRYNWRTRLRQGVLNGFSPPLIAPGQLTVGGFLRQHGYHTICIGKWHLGLELPDIRNSASLAVAEGPLTRGFDRFFGISASLDMPPYAFIRDDRFTAPLDTQKTLWRQRTGPAAADFTAEAVLPALSREAIACIRSQAGTNRPFFLYLPLTSPHTPIALTDGWKGKSGLGPYADFVMQTDAAVGEVLDALEDTGRKQNTVVIFTSDNGFAPAAEPGPLEKQGHFPSAGRRGYKSDVWEGGHRVPFIVRWPGKIKAGSTTGALACQIDLLATCADLLGAPLPGDSGGDSVSLLPVLTGAPDAAGRDNLVHHSIEGRFAIRQGRWKLAFCPGSGGWSPPSRGEDATGELPAVQLYDLAADPGETRNLQSENPEMVQRLTALLEQQIAEGRSTPGPRLANDVSGLTPAGSGREKRR